MPWWSSLTRGLTTEEYAISQLGAVGREHDQRLRLSFQWPRSERQSRFNFSEVTKCDFQHLMFCKIKCTCSWLYSWSNSMMPRHWKKKMKVLAGGTPHTWLLTFGHPFFKYSSTLLSLYSSSNSHYAYVARLDGVLQICKFCSFFFTPFFFLFPSWTVFKCSESFFRLLRSSVQPL